jgi:hypothetical protein
MKFKVYLVRDYHGNYELWIKKPHLDSLTGNWVGEKCYTDGFLKGYIRNQEAKKYFGLEKHLRKCKDILEGTMEFEFKQER